MWDFWSLSPESLIKSPSSSPDRGTPTVPPHGRLSSHAYSLINDKNELFYVKWHFKNRQASRISQRESAERCAGKDPDYAQRDLFNAIKEGNYPKWRVSVQIMPEKHADTYHLNPFDLNQSLAAQRLSARRSWRLVLDAIQKIISRKSNKLHSSRATSSPDGLRQTKCCKRALFPIPTRTATPRRNYDGCPSTSRSALCTPTIATAHELDGITARNQLRTQQLGGPKEAAQYRERPKKSPHGRPPQSPPRLRLYTQPGNLFR